MAKITYTADDGSTVDFLDPAGVQAAIDAAASNPPVSVEATEVDLLMSDGSMKKFIPSA